jgi:hypothetical protein
VYIDRTKSQCTSKSLSISKGQFLHQQHRRRIPAQRCTSAITGRKRRRRERKHNLVDDEEELQAIIPRPVLDLLDDIADDDNDDGDDGDDGKGAGMMAIGTIMMMTTIKL